MTTIQQTISNTLQFGNLPPEEREEMVLRVGAVIYQNVMTRTIEILEEKDQNEFEKMLDQNGGPDEVFSFLKAKIPGFEEIIKEEAEKFRNKASNIMDQIG